MCVCGGEGGEREVLMYICMCVWRGGWGERSVNVHLYVCVEGRVGREKC